MEVTVLPSTALLAQRLTMRVITCTTQLLCGKLKVKQLLNMSRYGIQVVHNAIVGT